MFQGITCGTRRSGCEPLKGPLKYHMSIHFWTQQSLKKDFTSIHLPKIHTFLPPTNHTHTVTHHLSGVHQSILIVNQHFSISQFLYLLRSLDCHYNKTLLLLQVFSLLHLCRRSVFPQPLLCSSIGQGTIHSLLSLLAGGLI